MAGGMAIAAIGMFTFTRLGVSSTYLTDVVPGLVITGLGLGLVFGSATNAATYGALAEDAGVASALVSTSQQIGGSIGTSLLNTLAASATATYLAHRAPDALVKAQATVHGDVVAFWVVAGILVGGAVLAALMFRSEPLAVDPDAPAVVVA
jgi:crotonobetainyl-CoA:carnitine CoA-transferase CaiB-like acyl-CoA transferase